MKYLLGIFERKKLFKFFFIDYAVYFHSKNMYSFVTLLNLQTCVKLKTNEYLKFTIIILKMKQFSRA